MTDDLTGRRVLVVEDECFLAADLVEALEEEGVEVLGPAASVHAALDLLAGTGRLDGAVLDLDLRGGMVFHVADALLARGVPLVFTTGYDEGIVPPRYSGVACCVKPVEASRVVGALRR